MLIKSRYTVPSTTAYLTHHISISPLLTHNVSLTDLVYCVDIVKTLYLVPLTVSSVQIYLPVSNCTHCDSRSCVGLTTLYFQPHSN